MDEQLRSLAQSHFDELQNRLQSRGMGGRIGFGERAAVLVVDLIRSFTDSSSPLGSDLDDVVEATARIATAAREVDAPVIFSTVFYDENLTDAGVWSVKIPANEALVEGSPWTEVDERLGQQPKDMMLVKKYASCFFGTDLSSRLISHGIDTLIVTGASTSGCVRASAIDACSLGFRAIVVSDAVGDRAPLSHMTSLFDLDTKYADVVTADEVLEYFGSRR